MRIDILRTFTEMFPPVLGASILGRAAQKGILEFNLCDIRQYSENKHHNTDDYPFGGGAGMVMLAQPIYSCLDAVDTEHKARGILLSPRGRTLSPEVARELAKEEHLLFLCGHYEGIDELPKAYKKLKDGETPQSPGMKYKHYAPKTETYLVEGESEKFAEFVNSKPNAAAVCFYEDGEKITVPRLFYGTAEDEKTLAHSVFAVLRKADKLGVSEIYVHAPSKSGIGLAVYNRLIRAAAFRVIKL